jgi:16S rRNA (cytosine1402-N4)-methyltransferase
MIDGHQAVLLRESIEGLAIVPHGIYVDGTFGRGGHSAAILEKLSEAGRLIAIDKDADAIAYAEERFGKDKRFQVVHDSFCELSAITHALGVHGRVNGILLDLGVSSPQLDNPARGFSFMKDGPLDMRMNKKQDFSARDFVNQATVEEMTRIFKTLGEERFALRIARALVSAREEKGPIDTTGQLAELVKHANPKWEKHKHPATRVFQAIRIHVNAELDELSLALADAVDVLAKGGRLAVISFHSLEDRIVKQFMRAQAEGEQFPVGVPIMTAAMHTSFKRIGKAVKSSEEEMKQNVRARSAVLRIGEKTS